MKLMLCLECNDMVLLRREPRSCSCGAATGQYLDDLATVEQTEGSISVALHNGDLHAAIQALRRTPDVWRPALCFRAFLNPHCEIDVRYLPREPHETTPRG